MSLRKCLLLTGALLAATVASTLSSAAAYAQSPAGASVPHLAGRGHVAMSTALRTTPALKRPSIIGGSAVPQGGAPYMAFILGLDGNQNPTFSCSGTIVGPRVVLTAGHCTLDDSGTVHPAADYLVVTGASDWTSAGATVTGVSHVIPKPGYVLNSSDDRNDLGLLVLSQPVANKAVLLADSNARALAQPGVQGTIMGWGDTTPGQTESTTVLQSGSTVIQYSSLCANAYGAFDAALTLCGEDSPDLTEGICSGDSGGPLTVADTRNRIWEVGISVFGDTNCDTNVPDGFTAVIPQYNWITSVIDKYTPLPRMTTAAAKFYSHEVILAAMGNTWKHRSWTRGAALCRRNSAARMTCGYEFKSGWKRYAFDAEVYFLAVGQGEVVWTDRWGVASEKSDCRSRCLIHRRHGSW